MGRLNFVTGVRLGPGPRIGDGGAAVEACCNNRPHACFISAVKPHCWPLRNDKPLTILFHAAVGSDTGAAAAASQSTAYCAAANFLTTSSRLASFAAASARRSCTALTASFRVAVAAVRRFANLACIFPKEWSWLSYGMRPATPQFPKEFLHALPA